MFLKSSTIKRRPWKGKCQFFCPIMFLIKIRDFDVICAVTLLVVWPFTNLKLVKYPLNVSEFLHTVE